MIRQSLINYACIEDGRKVKVITALVAITEGFQIPTL